MLDMAVIEIVQRANTPAETPQAKLAQQMGAMRPLTKQCVVESASLQSLELIKVLSVLGWEAGRLGLYQRNTDGSYDIGPMQVNSIHLPDLARKFSRPQAEIATLLGYDGCFNVAVGSMMLRARTNEANGDFWMGIGRYHSKTPAKAARYILNVHAVMTEIANKENNRIQMSAKGS